MSAFGRKSNRLKTSQLGAFSRLQETLDQAHREQEISTTLICDISASCLAASIDS